MTSEGSREETDSTENSNNDVWEYIGCILSEVNHGKKGYTNNYLPLFLGSSNAKKMDPEELNEILLHAVPNSWERQAYLQGWDLEGRT